MYVPAQFAADETLLNTLAPTRLAILVTHGANGLWATHLPLLWDAERRVLEGHVARPNPHHKDGAAEAMAIFAGPDAYVSPSFYPSKAEHGRQVPTWNYEAVHVYGALAWFEDRERLLAQVRALSERHEAGRSAPWTIEDASEQYIDALLRGIVGVSIRVTRIEAKQKLSQNKSDADRIGVETGLVQDGADAVAAVMKAMREK